MGTASQIRFWGMLALLAACEPSAARQGERTSPEHPPRDPARVVPASQADLRSDGGTNPWGSASSTSPNPKPMVDAGPATSPASALPQVTVALLDSTAMASPKAARDPCGLMPGDPREPVHFTRWDQSASCRARRIGWSNIPHGHVRCTADADCVVVVANCYSNPFNRKAAALPRYRKPPCGNPARGKCLDPGDQAVCVRGCCRAGYARDALRTEMVQRGLVQRTRKWLAACAVEPGPAGNGLLTLTYDRDGDLLGAEQAPPFRGTPRGDCLVRAAREARVGYSTGGMEVRITFRLAP